LSDIFTLDQVTVNVSDHVIIWIF